MKALLIGVNLMFMVVVPDDATEEQVMEATTQRALFVMNADPTVISVGYQIVPVHDGILRA